MLIVVLRTWIIMILNMEEKETIAFSYLISKIFCRNEGNVVSIENTDGSI